MLRPFEIMPGHSRLWIYQSSRPFTQRESGIVDTRLSELCQGWAAHGNPLQTSFTIVHDQFIVLVVDEQAEGASGCSIDGTVRLMKDLMQTLGLDFFDRSRIAFLERGSVVLHPASELKTLFETGVLNGESVTFNNTLTTKSEWETQWQVPSKASWLSRYLPKPAGVGQPG